MDSRLDAYVEPDTDTNSEDSAEMIPDKIVPSNGPEERLGDDEDEDEEGFVLGPDSIDLSAEESSNELVLVDSTSESPSYSTIGPSSTVYGSFTYTTEYDEELSDPNILILGNIDNFDDFTYKYGFIEETPAGQILIIDWRKVKKDGYKGVHIKDGLSAQRKELAMFDGIVYNSWWKRDFLSNNTVYFYDANGRDLTKLALDDVAGDIFVGDSAQDTPTDSPKPTKFPKGKSVTKLAGDADVLEFQRVQYPIPSVLHEIFSINESDLTQFQERPSQRKILHINTLDAFDMFTRMFGVLKDDGLHIDWDDVKSKYSGIYLDKGVDFIKNRDSIAFHNGDPYKSWIENDYVVWGAVYLFL